MIIYGGYKDNITITQLKTNLEMESHEEKLHNMIKSSKMESAKESAKEAARIIMDKKRLNNVNSGISSLDSSTYSNDNNNNISATSTTTVTTTTINNNINNSNISNPVAAPIKGMDIGIKLDNKNKSLFEALVKEEKLTVLTKPINTINTNTNTDDLANKNSNNIIQQPIMLSAVEKISATLTRDGDVSNVDIKGNLTLTAIDDNVACCGLQLALDRSSSKFTFNTHPKVNKALFDKNSILIMKDTSKGFPSGRPVGILRWSNNQSSSDYIPLTVNCWPEEESKNIMLVTIDYSSLNKYNLHDVKIIIPILSHDTPNIKTVDGRYKFNKNNNELIWEIDLIDASNTSGNLEFTITEKDPNSFFPISISFSSQQMQCDIDVLSVKSIPVGGEITTATGTIPYGYTKGMSTEDYVIE